jgi:hypothetical protein
MGKTGSIEWVKIKGRKGQVRQVAKAETVYKKPGPMQKYASTGSRIKKIKRSEKATSVRTWSIAFDLRKAGLVHRITNEGGSFIHIAGPEVTQIAARNFGIVSYEPDED